MFGSDGICGVFEPLQPLLVTTEVDCFTGVSSEIADGAFVEEGGIIAVGVFEGGSITRVDRNRRDLLWTCKNCIQLSILVARHRAR